MELILKREIQDAGYDGTDFIKNLKASVESRKKCDREERFIHYRNWARALKRKKIGSSNDFYKYPDSVLKFIRTLFPTDIKDEKREGAYEVSMEQFCSALDFPAMKKP